MTRQPCPVTLLAVLLNSLLGILSCRADVTAGSLGIMDEVASIPAGKYFHVEREGGKLRFGDPVSVFPGCTNTAELTFDVSNLRALGSMGEMGQLKALTIFRDSYRHCAKPPGFPGVWTAKDLSSYGPYLFGLEIDQGSGSHESIVLNEKLPWDYRITLLDNIFPVAELKDPKERFKVRLLAFAPLSSDGSERPAGLVYHLWLENTGTKELKGILKLPKLFGDRPTGRWAWQEPYEFELGFADGAPLNAETIKNGLPFSLKPGEKLSAPLVLYMPGTEALDEIQKKGELAWFQDTWRYNRNLLGRLTIPSDPWLAEFVEREILESLGSLTMGPTGKLSGSNWGTYPANRQTWAKDCFYSSLPAVMADPKLAAPIIEWFHENGVRHHGAIIEGGINHSISLTVSSLMLAGIYYDQTGDAKFFLDRTGLRSDWEKRLEALEASRKFPGIELYPTRHISDGPVEGDFHTGSNIAVWYAIKSFSRLLAEVYKDPVAAKLYAERADQMKADILKKTVINGKFGPQFVEGVNHDGSVPSMTSDGEESEISLIPFYGFLSSDDPLYRASMRFAMSPENKQYTPATHSINWGSTVPSTAPGYNKGLCIGGELRGEHGPLTEIRRVTDADGSVWWWPVNFRKEGADVAAGKAEEKEHADGGTIQPKRGPGKAGWFSGVYSTLFRSRFAGVDFDAPTRTLTWKPLPSLGDFEWQDLRFGNERFGLKLALTGKDPHATVTNPNGSPITVRLRLPAGEGTKLLVDGKAISYSPQSYFGETGLAAELTVPAGGRVTISLTK